jgi:hypothetical protein
MIRIKAGLVALIALGAGSARLDGALSTLTVPDTTVPYVVQVDVKGLARWQGVRAEGSVRSLVDGRESIPESVRVPGQSLDLELRGYVHDGGGPYSVHVWLDLDCDGRCDAPPVDAVWVAPLGARTYRVEIDADADEMSASC